MQTLLIMRGQCSMLRNIIVLLGNSRLIIFDSAASVLSVLFITDGAERCLCIMPQPQHLLQDRAFWVGEAQNDAR